MTRSDLIRIINDKMSHLSRKDVEATVKYVFDAMSNALVSDGRIEIRGFGSFTLRFRPERVARNPKTGELLTSASKHTAHFKPGKLLRDGVNASGLLEKRITEMVD